MKVLIITVPLGNGHTSCANAIKQYFDSINIENKILDLYEYIDPKLKTVIEKAYYYTMKSVSSIRPVANEIYNINELTEPHTHIFSSLNHEIQASLLGKFIDNYQPQIIICTQVYATQVINILKENQRINSLTCGIITDFTVQTYWEDTKYIDYIDVCDKNLFPQLLQRKINEERILTYGIPISLKFSKKCDKSYARFVLSLNQEIKTILLMTGGMGFGDLEKHIKDIDQSSDNTQIIVICGKNKSLFTELSNMKCHNKLVLVEYTDKVDLYMDACDYIVTKPGGITTSEALSKNIPIITFEELPGMEERNIEFLQNMGCILRSCKTFPVSYCLQILENSEIRKNISNAQKILAKPNSTKDMCDFLLRQLD